MLSEIYALGNCSAIVKFVKIVGHHFNLKTRTLDTSAQL